MNSYCDTELYYHPGKIELYDMSSFKNLNLNFLKSLNSIGDKIDESAFTNFVQSTLDIHIKQK